MATREELKHLIDGMPDEALPFITSRTNKAYSSFCSNTHGKPSWMSFIARLISPRPICGG